ncbi:SWIM zinc finger family protein [Kibdelosporangium lantanae]
MNLPPVSAEVVATVLDGLPQRLRKRVDAALNRASTWTSSTVESQWTVTVDDDTTLVFTLRDGVLTSADDLTCTCLLAPKCLHRAVAVSVAPAVAVAVAVATDAPVSTAELSPEGLAAAELLWEAASAVLRAGVSGSGTVVQASLLRAVHTARLAGLYRASSVALRVVAGVRAAHARSSDFHRATMTADLSELLLVCHQLRTGVGDVAALRGTARREYRPVGSLRLYGLFTERVVASSGYAGVVTHLVDADGVLWTVNAVTPGGSVAGALDGPVAIGESGLTHRTSGRSGLLLSAATASADHRLGAGTNVRAVAAEGVAWTSPPVSSLWAEPLDDQVRRAFSSSDSLLFLSGSVVGSTGGALRLAVDDRFVDLVGSCDTSWDNLGLLASLTAKRLLVIARLLRDRPSTAEALAVSGDITLPSSFEGRVNVTLDRLQRSHVDNPRRMATATPASARSPVELLERWLHRATLGGRKMPMITSTAADQARLTRLGLTGTAQLLGALEKAARDERRDAFGRLVARTDDEFVLAWLRGCVHAAEFTRSVAATRW